MKSRVTNCPACGGPVEFRASSSLVTVCPFCKSVVARGDKNPEDHGKVADLVQTNSPLAVATRGRYRERSFEVVGRVQYTHPSGATWNEWYLLFPEENWGWLAEAQGRLYLMFEKRLKSTATIATWDSIELGQSFDLMKTRLAVADKAIAVVHAAEGEIPWAVRPNLEHRYADLRGEGGAIATIDFGSEPPHIYVGNAVSVEELHLVDNGWIARQDTIATTGLQVNCPKCAGPLALRAPDETLRVICPSCNAILDANHGKLAYIETLANRAVKIVLPIGSKGKLFEQEYTVIGFMERYVLYEGKSYPWTEYLLHNPTVGFRWLVNSSDHWSFVEPADYPADKVMEASTVLFEGKTFRKFDQGTAFVRYVVGEFPWRVTLGEAVETTDYIAPPNMLSFEHSISIKPPPLTGTSNTLQTSVASEEINVSKGTYLPPEVLQAAFNLESIKIPFGVGAIQPPPETGYHFWTTFLAFFGFLSMTYLILQVLRPSKPPDFLLLLIAIGLIAVMPICIGLYRQAFEMKRWENSDFSPYSVE